MYEPIMLIGGKRFRPDFYLPDLDLFIEICGYNHMPFYKDRTAHKQNLYNKYDIRSIFINYDGKGSLENILEKSLLNYAANRSD